jgi:hypothetical protein
MTRRAIVTALALCLSAIGAGAASANGCDGDVILRNDFEQPPADWKPAQQIDAVDGKLQVTPEPRRSVALPINVEDAQEYEVCVTVSRVAGPGKYASLILSAPDSGSEFFFTVNSDGTADIHEYWPSSEKWVALVEPRPDAAIRSGSGVENRLRLVVSTFDVKLFVNGQAFDSVFNTLALQPTKLQLQLVSDESGPSTWTIDDLLVTSIGPEADADAGRQAISADQLNVVNALFPSDLGLTGFAVAKRTDDAHPDRGVAQLTFVLQGKDSDSTGQAVFRFYRTADEAAAYLRPTGRESGPRFVDDVEAASNGTVAWGRTDDAGSPAYFGSAVDAEGGAERAWAAVRIEDAVAIASLVIPRPGVQTTDAVRADTISRAIDAVGKLSTDFLAAQLPRHPVGSGNVEK